MTAPFIEIRSTDNRLSFVRIDTIEALEGDWGGTALVHTPGRTYHLQENLDDFKKRLGLTVAPLPKGENT